MNYTQIDLNGNPQRTPDEILTAACAEREPVVITAAFSGGDDSLATLHVAAQVVLDSDGQVVEWREV
jgi:3'-phosphoadenosine 5'-phosphosulfate sulfotransferase (PAPS reductase)/FAD synthetase